MKVIKYILFAALVFALWVTKPIWMPKSNYFKTTSQDVERDTLIKTQEQDVVLESKFGKKSSVMPALKKYWDNKYIDAVEFELVKCSDVKAGDQGWIIVCSYRLTGFMRQNTYTINKGNVSK